MTYTVKFHAAWWLKLKQLGYDVIPLLRGKDSPYKGWPTMPNDEAAIQDWRGSSAAIRMYRSELFVIDLDIHASDVRDQMLEWLTTHHPEFMANCLRRHSERITLALIGRCVTAKGTQKTARYKGPDAAPKGDFVEVFTGVGILGRHSEQTVITPGKFFRQQVYRDYGYHGRTILEVPADALPWFPDSGIAAMLAAFEQIMVVYGWEKKVPVLGEEAAGTKVYDLLPEMIFILSDGGEITLLELEEMAKHGMTLTYDHNNPSDTRLRGYATLWDPDTGGGAYSNTRVLVTYGGEGLCLYDTKFDVRHRWKSAEPKPNRLGEELREIMKLMMEKAEAKAAADAEVLP